jgi:hypothetical protein
MISVLLGFSGVIFVALVTLCLALRWPAARAFLITALSVRVGAMMFGYFVTPLPDSGNDAHHFELVAWEWGQAGFAEAFDHFPGPDSYFISWVLAVLYSVTDRSLLMAQSVSLLFGMGAVFLGWRLARKLWGDSVAVSAGWMLALFPTLVLYSTLTLREAYVWFFLLVALHGVVDWVRSGGVSSIALVIVGFASATYFHGAMILGALCFLLILGISELQRTLGSLTRGRVHLVSVGVLAGAIIGVMIYVSGSISVPKLGYFESAADVDGILSKIASTTGSSNAEDGASYPLWTVPNSSAELLYKAPVRVAYFIFSPFPWNVQSLGHLIGLFDGLLYMILVFFIWRNREAIWADRATRMIVILLGVYLVVFGLVIGNFGTGIRHRAKFVAALIVLAAPVISRLVLVRANSYKFGKPIKVADSASSGLG